MFSIFLNGFLKQVRFDSTHCTASLFLDLIAGVFVIPSIVHNSLNSIDYNRQVYSTLEVATFASTDETPSAEAAFFGVMGIISTITAVFR